MTQSNCWKCGQPGHFAANCPLQLRAASHAEHLDRIAVIVNRWVNGEISTGEKRARISDENVQWHGPDVPRRLVYAPAPDA